MMRPKYSSITPNTSYPIKSAMLIADRDVGRCGPPNWAKECPIVFHSISQLAIFIGPMTRRMTHTQLILVLHRSVSRSGTASGSLRTSLRSHATGPVCGQLEIPNVIKRCGPNYSHHRSAKERNAQHHCPARNDAETPQKIGDGYGDAILSQFTVERVEVTIFFFELALVRAVLEKVHNSVGGRRSQV